MEPGGDFFERLKGAAANDWRDYCTHEFVRRMGAGDLPEGCFRHYLIQDYLFLIHFARAYGLALYKSSSLGDMREAADALAAILNVEMDLHIKLCARWGLNPEELEMAEEATDTMAYTRFVLERGMAGDVLDLHVALAPCVIGYGEIGSGLAGQVGRELATHPYRDWIGEYAGAPYQAVARAARERLDRLASERLTPARFSSLSRTFRQATRLEARFWQMGLDQAG